MSQGDDLAVRMTHDLIDFMRGPDWMQVQVAGGDGCAHIYDLMAYIGLAQIGGETHVWFSCFVEDAEDVSAQSLVQELAQASIDMQNVPAAERELSNGYMGELEAFATAFQQVGDSKPCAAFVLQRDIENVRRTLLWCPKNTPVTKLFSYLQRCAVSLYL